MTKKILKLDIGDLYIDLADIILPALKEFRKRTFSYPSSFEKMNEWEDVLDEMIFAFEKITEDEELFFEEEVEQKVQKGLELFGKHFRNLWI